MPGRCSRGDARGQRSASTRGSSDTLLASRPQQRATASPSIPAISSRSDGSLGAQPLGGVDDHVDAVRQVGCHRERARRPRRTAASGSNIASS
jgi:hypothetical protein